MANPTLTMTQQSARPRTQFVATCLAIVAGSAMMAGMLGFYISRRHLVKAPGTHWVPDDVTIPNAQLVMAVVTAVLASFVAHWAVWAGRRGERGHAYTALGLALLMCIMFINMVIFSLNRMGIEIGAGEWQNLAFAVTGVVITMAVIATVYLALMGLRALGGDLGPEGTAPLASAVLLWDFVAVAYSAAFYVVYVVK
jgi:heme/copper-type cytochrome/quinol oxidase subunit 3